MNQKLLFALDDEKVGHYLTSLQKSFKLLCLGGRIKVRVPGATIARKKIPV